MFLQRDRISHRKEQARSVSIKGTSRLQQVLRNMNIPQIKPHLKTKPVSTTRNQLISQTHNIFKQSPLIYTRMRQNPSASLHRQCRTSAARTMREKLSKPSDIASLMRTQERLSQSQLLPSEQVHNPETVGRYQDMLQEFSQSIKAEKKQILRSYYMTTPLRTNQRPHSSKNAEVQVTNIEFISNNSPSKTSKGRRKEAKNRAHFSYTYQGRKLVKHNSGFQDDSFIEPW